MEKLAVAMIAVISVIARKKSNTSKRNLAENCEAFLTISHTYMQKNRPKTKTVSVYFEKLSFLRFYSYE